MATVLFSFFSSRLPLPGFLSCRRAPALLWRTEAEEQAKKRTAAEEEAKKRKTKTRPSPFWLKEYHGFGGGNFCLPETGQKLTPLESPRGGKLLGGGNFCRGGMSTWPQGRNVAVFGSKEESAQELNPHGSLRGGTLLQGYGR